MSRLRADSLLILITLVWGTSFTIVADALSHMGVASFLALRFTVATLALVPFLLRRRAELRQGLGPGVLLGLMLFGGFYAQTAGLMFTTPARSAFVTGLCVVLVPVLGALSGQRVSRHGWLGVALGFLGLLILSWGCHLPQLGCAAVEAARPRMLLGDLLTLAGAAIFAGHIVAVSHYSHRHAARPLGAIQIATVAAICVLLALAKERPPVAPSASVLAAAVFLGLVATAVNFTLQIALQRHTSATHAALIYSLEPVFALTCSWLLGRERITAATIAGGLLMLTGVIVAELGVHEPFEAVAASEDIEDDRQAHSRAT